MRNHIQFTITLKTFLEDGFISRRTGEWYVTKRESRDLSYTVIMIDNKVVRIFNQGLYGKNPNSIESNSAIFEEIQKKYEEYPVLDYPVNLLESMTNCIQTLIK